MTKSELIAAVAAAANLTKAQATEAVDITFNTIITTVASGESVSLPGFGTFEKRHREARMGRNPQTGEEKEIAAMDVPGFKAGKKFKDEVKGEG